MTPVPVTLAQYFTVRTGSTHPVWTTSHTFSLYIFHIIAALDYNAYTVVNKVTSLTVERAF